VNRHIAITLLAIAGALTLQVTIVPETTWAGVRPNCVLLAIIFLSIYLPWPACALVGLLAGAACDMLTLERFGMFTIIYGLTAFAVAIVRDYLFVFFVSVLVSLTWIIQAFIGMVWLVYRWVYYPEGIGSMGKELWQLFGSAAYTALLVLPVQYVLLKLFNRLKRRPPGYHAVATFTDN